MTNLQENEHPLSSPELIGTDEEKIEAIKLWADLVGIVRSVNSTLISYKNKRAMFDELKKEIEKIEIEIDNIAGVVREVPGEIPAIVQVPPSEVPTVPAQVVDLSVSEEKVIPEEKKRKVPTFSDLDKLRRCAGSGIWDKNYKAPTKVVKK